MIRLLSMDESKLEELMGNQSPGRTVRDVFQWT